MTVMKSPYRLFAAVLFGITFAPLATGEGSASMPDQPLASFTRASDTEWNLDWQGVTGRTYFIQTSVDLVHWEYEPYMAFGSGIWHSLLGSLTPKYFVRLFCVDDSSVTTLQEAKDADFDNDGISNLYEIQTLGSDPMNKDSNGEDSDNDGLSDGWEMFHFGGLNIADPNAVLKPDGLTNKEKANLGLNPNTDYSAATATQPASYIYDPVGRLTGVTAPVGGGTYAPDEEGNLLNAQ